MKTVKAQTPEIDSLPPGHAESPDAPAFSNPLKLLKTPRSWCHPDDLISALEQRLTEDEEELDFQEMNEAHFAFCSPDELALALAFAVEDWLPAWMPQDKIEARMLRGNQALLEASEAAAGSARQARLLTDALEAWHSDGRRQHLHQVNGAVYEMMGIAVNESRLELRARQVLQSVFDKFLQALPSELGLRHILFLHSLNRLAPQSSERLLEDHQDLILFQEHIQSVGEFLKLSSWLLEMPHFVQNGPEDADETQCLLDTAQDCRADLEFWAEQAQTVLPSPATEREIRTRLALIALVLALRSRMWQDAAALVENYQMQDLRVEQDEAAAQTLTFAVELVPMIARHQFEPRENLRADLEQARERLPLVTELINELEECFCAEQEETVTSLEDAVPHVHSSQFHALPFDPMPVSQTPGESADELMERHRVLAELVDDVVPRENEEHQRKLREDLKMKPRSIRGHKAKSRSARKTQKILGKKMAAFSETAGLGRAGNGNHRRNVVMRTVRQAKRSLSELDSAKITALAAGIAFLAVTGVLVTLGLTGNPSVNGPQMVLDAKSPTQAKPAPTAQVNTDQASGTLNNMLSSISELTDFSPRADATPTVTVAEGARSNRLAPPREAMAAGSAAEELSEMLEVKKIIYFDGGEKEKVKAAHINDWVYREGEELVDFSTGNRIAFRVARIEPNKVLLKNKTQELLLTLEEAASGAL